MTCAEFQELAGGLVLGVLDPEERAAALAHLAEPTHEGCPQALARAHRTLGQLPDALDDLRPAAATWRAVEAWVAPPGLRPWLTGLGWAAALVLAVVSVWLARGKLRTEDREAQATRRLAALEQADARTRSALALLEAPGSRVIHLAPQGAQRGDALAAISADGTRAVLLSRSLPPVPGKDYELWAIPPNGAPVPAGLVQGRAGAWVSAPFAPGALPGAVALAVSLEPAGGAPDGKPSAVILVGNLQG
jgi:anti-sigma-K factor RskA